MRRNFALFFVLALPMLACAYHAEIGGIYYNFSGEEAEVTYQAQVDYFPSFVSDYSGAVVIPESVTYGEMTYRVTRIGHFAFNGCRELDSVSIPGTVTSIGGEAFYGCTSLTSIIIPESVTSIGDGAFENCSGLTSVVIPGSVTGISESAFAYCRSLASVDIPEGVTRIGGFAFSGCSSLSSIAFPESVTSIGRNAFIGTTWYGNQQDGMVYAGRVAYRFKGTMSEGTHVAIEEGTAGIADNAFADQPGLASIAIPESVTSIGKSAFRGCRGLTSITIPSGVASIGGGAFEDCTGLEKVIVPDIAAWCGIAFGDYIANPLYYAQHIYSNDTSEITDLYIPAGVTSIGMAAFNNCISLSAVTIPASVTSIAGIAFYGCKGLSDILCAAVEVPEASAGVFNNLPSRAVTLYVPEASADLYRTTAPWSSFGTIVAIGDLNNDAKVDIADGVSVLNIMAAGEYSEAADVNGDGKVDVADFVTILNIMAGGAFLVE